MTFMNFLLKGNERKTASDEDAVVDTVTSIQTMTYGHTGLREPLPHTLRTR